MRRLTLATAFLFTYAVLSAGLAKTSLAQETPPAVPSTSSQDETGTPEQRTPADDAAAPMQDRPAGQAAPNQDPFPQLQTTPPPTRRPGTGRAGAGTPDFLRGIQLADTGSRPGRQSYQSLLAPAQFHGNLFGSGGSITFIERRGQFNDQFSGDIPLAGGNARFSIADNNKPLPQNRVFFNYNHFSNAIGTDIMGPPGTPVLTRRRGLDSYVFGFEKTVGDDELTSIEVRIPFSGYGRIDSFGYGVEGGSFGNVPVSVKRSLLISETYSVVAGSAFVTPTGDGAQGQLFGTPFNVDNKAWHLVPFVGVMLIPTANNAGDSFDSLISPAAARIGRRLSYQFFGQVDFPLNDQEVLVPGVPRGSFSDSTLMSLDAAIVMNLCSRPRARTLTRLDASVELHYTKDIGGGDSFVTEMPSMPMLAFSQNRINSVLNLTAGVSAEIRRSTRIQLAAAAPLASRDALQRRAFDGEFILSINRFF